MSCVANYVSRVNKSYTCMHVLGLPKLMDGWIFLVDNELQHQTSEAGSEATASWIREV